MAIGSVESYNATPITAGTTQIKTGDGVLGGIFCSSSTSGTVTIYDNTTTSGTAIVATFTVAAGTFYRLPAAFATGCRIVVANTASVTVFWL